MKRITSVIAALLIVVNITINVFAEAAPVPFNPNITVVSGGSNSPVTSFLGELLIGAGVSSDLITDHKGTADFYKEATERFTQEYLETGQYPDTITAEDGNEYTLGEYMQYLYVKSLEEERDSWYKAMYDMGWNFYDYVHKNEKNIIPTSTIDLFGYGARIEYYTNGKLTSVYFCDYMEYYPDSPPSNNDLRTFGVIHCYSVGFNGVLKYDYDLNVSSWYKYHQDVSASNYCKYYGDIRCNDGSELETDDEFEYVVGETPDGTKVTVDMLNPDGTVDGQPVTPDLTKFDEEAILDLINDMLEASKNTYETADPDNDVNPDDISVPEVSEELGNFTVSPSIITVFPFCLPFDFVRGMKTLVQKPKVPVFKAELDLTYFCGYDLGKHEIEISLEKWEPAAVVCRWFSILLFTYTLILLTGKIVKGAGA